MRDRSKAATRVNEKGRMKTSNADLQHPSHLAGLRHSFSIQTQWIAENSAAAA